jgi:hypothetical protein
MIRDGDDGEPEALRLEHDGGTRRLAIRAGADGRDPRGLYVVEGVEERLRSEVECVVVGKRHAIDAEVRERLDGDGRRPEVEDASRERFAALGDAALQVEDEEVGLARDGDELRRHRRLRRLRLEPLRDPPPKHRVACECQLHGAKPWRPTSGTKCAPISLRTRTRAPSRFLNRTTSSLPP